MIISISWRNVWRNKLRSSVILTAVGLGMIAGIFIWAFNAGMVNKRIETAISTEASNIQIHKKGYLEDPNVNKLILNSDSIIGIIENHELVKGASGRLLVSGMAMSAEKGTGAMVMGIVPEKEMKITDIHKNIVEGKYFEGIKRNPIVIGKKLAEKLNLKVRSKVILTFQQMDGSIIKAQFRVCGIYDITNNMYEEVNLFVRFNDLSNIINMNLNASNEIAIKMIDNHDEEQVFGELKEKFSEFDVKIWRELLPEINLIEESTDISMFVFIIIILLGLCLAIVNTMLMAVLERVKEIGMLMAIGMNKIRVFLMILMETIFLTFTGTILGVILSIGISYYFGIVGIDLSSGAEVYESMGFSAIVYPMLRVKYIIIVMIMVSIASVLSSIFPAIKALRLNPADAIRSDV
jgi:putative ABC transport system permease protein